MKLELMNENMAKITPNEFIRIHTYIAQGYYKDDWLLESKRNFLFSNGKEFLFQCPMCESVYDKEIEKKECCGASYE